MERCMEDIDNDITTVVMNIRELLMNYYKGSCVNSITSSGNIRIVKDFNINRQQHLYERRELELVNKSILLIGDLRIFTLTHNPNKIVFYSTLERSPQLLGVRKGIETFMNEFLMGVEKVYINRPRADVTKIIDDTKLLGMTRIRTQEDKQNLDLRMSRYFFSSPLTTYMPTTALRPAIEWTEETVF